MFKVTRQNLQTKTDAQLLALFNHAQKEQQSPVWESEARRMLSLILLEHARCEATL